MRLLPALCALLLSSSAVAGLPPLPPSPVAPSPGTVAEEGEVHRVRTLDGAEVVLSRYPNPGKPAVVLCHGISSNHRFWDLEPGRSLALYLHDVGWDVWNLDLRGHGLAVVDGTGHRQQAGWTIDDYGIQDLPAAFAYVRQQTGQAKLSYVGHSMGGMVLAVYLATHDDVPLSTAVVAGSPLDFRDPDAMTKVALRGSRLFLGGFLPTPMGARLIAGFRSFPFADDILYDPPNVADPAVRKEMLRSIVSPLSGGEVHQLALARTGEFLSADRRVAYRESLGKVTVPMMFLAGRADRIVNPDRVYGYYEAVGSADKQFVVASTANGFHGDYGHLDFGIADHAIDDVFPRIASWLDGHRP